MILIMNKGSKNSKSIKNNKKAFFVIFEVVFDHV